MGPLGTETATEINTCLLSVLMLCWVYLYSALITRESIQALAQLCRMLRNFRASLGCMPSAYHLAYVPWSTMQSLLMRLSFVSFASVSVF